MANNQNQKRYRRDTDNYRIIHDLLTERLKRPGPIALAEACELLTGEPYSYYVLRAVFCEIMLEMIENKLAVDDGRCRYTILPAGVTAKSYEDMLEARIRRIRTPGDPKRVIVMKEDRVAELATEGGEEPTDINGRRIIKSRRVGSWYSQVYGKWMNI